jgi:hypothetical protein
MAQRALHPVLAREQFGSISDRFAQASACLAITRMVGRVTLTSASAAVNGTAPGLLPTA